MVERVYEWEGGCAIKSSAVVQSGSDTDRGLVDIGNAEIDFSHFEEGPRSCGVGGISSYCGVKCYTGQLATLLFESW